jgi:hypothetical protein
MRFALPALTVRFMHPGQPISDRATAAVPGGPLTQLPVAYAIALALQRAGVPLAVMAEQLELPAESMPALLEVAAAKLAALGEHAFGENETTSDRNDERNPRD